MRYDAGLREPGPFHSRGEVMHQTLEPADFAVTTHVGPYSTLTAAFPEIYERAVSLRGYRLVGLPVVEIMQTTHIDSQRELNHTDVYVPVERLGSSY